MTNTIYRGSGFLQTLRDWLDSERLDEITSQLVFAVVGLIVAALVGFVGFFLWEKWRLHRRAVRIGLESLPPGEQMRLARQLGFYDDLLQLLARHQIVRPRHLTPLEFSRSLTFLPADAYETLSGFDFAALITSSAVLNGESKAVTITSGRNATRLTGVKSAIGSYGFWSASRIALTLCDSVVM